MSAWPIVALRDCCSVISGATPKTNNKEFWDGDISWTSPKDLTGLTGKYLYSTPKKITQKGYDSCSTKLLPVGSVLLSSRAPIGHVAIAAEPVCTNQGYKSLVPDTAKIDSVYLYYWLKSKKHYLQSLGNGATFKEISKGIVESVEIPLPPLNEQRRIAGILDKADELLKRRHQTIERLDQLVQSIFLDMFGDPVTNPKNWPVKQLSAFGQVVTGNTPSKSNPENYGGHMEWIKSDNLNNSADYATIAEETLSEVGTKIARTVPAGSILVTCIAGSLSCIGNLGIADRTVAFNQQINAVVSQRVPSEFLYYLLKTSRKLIQTASTNSMKGMVNKSKFETILLPFPEPSLQDQFSDTFRKFHEQKHKLLESEKKTEALFFSLQQRAFKGTL